MEKPSDVSSELLAFSNAVVLPIRPWNSMLQEVTRFGLVGVLNVCIDLLVFNLLFWLFPTEHTDLLLLYSVSAYGLGAVNSFLLNKHWTFRYRQRTDGAQMLRFVAITILGISCNTLLIWLLARLFQPFFTDPWLWANSAKVVALLGSALISYLGMRLWVFARNERGRGAPRLQEAAMPLSEHEEAPCSACDGSQEPLLLTERSLSVILPAHNEEAVIAQTLRHVVDVLTPWVPDFEVVVVNDGSKDGTRAVVEAFAVDDRRIRLIDHAVNQGYGAALASGFQAVTKELAFFMDADGQFDLHDLGPFLPLIERYDAVLGYRIARQDTIMRKLNAWGWKLLTSLVFGLRVRDVDCAFKLYHSSFLHLYRLETRGAMINTEMLYKLKRGGYTYTQVGVRHLPRRSGRATGAKVSVIIRAFNELAFYAYKWRREEWKASQAHRYNDKGIAL